MLDVLYKKVLYILYVYAFAARTYILGKAEGHVFCAQSDFACLASYRLGATTTGAD
jgi:hypothetical protein